MKFMLLPAVGALLLCACATAPAPSAAPNAATAPPAVPKGEVIEGPTAHTAASLRELVQNAQVSLPAAANGGSVFNGKFKDIPASANARVPVVVFLHGSSGLGLKAIAEWQQWLAAHSSRPQAARAISAKTALGDAPGEYVMRRYME